VNGPAGTFLLQPQNRALSSIQMNTIPTFVAFAGLGPQEIFLIFLAILLLFGAKKLPEFARGLGKSMGEFKKARQEFEHEITKSVEEKDTKI
jgi:sec-independent protein translocase protein TatA